jgi:hypothetical protein
MMCSRSDVRDNGSFTASSEVPPVPLFIEHLGQDFVIYL